MVMHMHNQHVIFQIEQKNYEIATKEEKLEKLADKVICIYRYLRKHIHTCTHARTDTHSCFSYSVP